MNESELQDVKNEASESKSVMPCSPVTIQFPLPGGNCINVTMKRKLTRAEYQRVKKLFDMFELALTEDE